MRDDHTPAIIDQDEWARRGQWQINNSAGQAACDPAQMSEVRPMAWSKK
jgi:hypothetical protein